MPNLDGLLISNVQGMLDATMAANRKFGSDAPYWQGASDVRYSLQPSVYRQPYDEISVMHRFKSKALGRLGHRRIPASAIEWLFLAQHYGVPTRLLDWTESALVALWFAVCFRPNPDVDGRIWALQPSLMNSAVTGQQGLIQFDDPLLGRMAAQAFNPRPLPSVEPGRDVIDEELDLPAAVALGTWEMDERIIAQSGTFTLHRDPRPLELYPNSDWLLSFTIPAASKPTIKSEIERIGVQSTSLFPDLVSLGAELARPDAFFIPEAEAKPV